MHRYITSDDGPTFNRVFIYTLLHRQMHAVFINIECIHTYTYLRTDLRTDEARVLFTYPFYPDISFVSNCNQSITAFNPIRTDTLLELHSLKYTYIHTYLNTFNHIRTDTLLELHSLKYTYKHICIHTSGRR